MYDILYKSLIRGVSFNKHMKLDLILNTVRMAN
jgi:hypothetical protein